MTPAPSSLETELAADLLAQALKAGADQAEVVFADRRAVSVGVREGRLEDIEREESRDLGLRVFVGLRQATASTSDLSADSRGRLVDRTLAMARLAPEDPHARLADREQLASGGAEALDLFDGSEVTPSQLQSLAAESEAAGLGVEGVARSEGGHASSSSSRWQLVTSQGFRGQYQASAFSLGVGVIAEKDGAMERGGDSRTTRWFADLPSPARLGLEAGTRAVARTGARKIASTTAPVIFDNRMSAQVVAPLLGAISGPSIARGTSFLKDQMGKALLPAGVDLIDDPFRPRGLGSTPFDDEGVAVTRREIVSDGVLTTWLLNTASASQLGLRSTGHASRALAGPSGVSTHNLHLRHGFGERSSLLEQAGTGLLVTSMFGPSLNGNTGDWSAGVSGFWFERGQIAYPVTEVTVAGNLKALWARMVPGDDLEFRGRMNLPSLLFDAVAIAGK